LSRIINFNQAKVAHCFNQFAKDGALTDTILSDINVNFHFQSDIDDFLSDYKQKDRKRFYNILLDIKDAVYQMTSEDNMDLRHMLEDEYFKLLQNLETNDTKYKIPSVLIKYRKDINPIRALKFELQEIMSMYNSLSTIDDDYHEWLATEFKNEKKIKKIILSVKNDMVKIVDMQKRYKRAKKKHSYFVLPMSYYHCVEIESDMVTWIKTLQEFLVWVMQDDIKSRYS
tara:strand:+ start:341 stop:1024 length:684 start_codon:yes stop_codon:yes gene_type:complete